MNGYDNHVREQGAATEVCGDQQALKQHVPAGAYMANGHYQHWLPAQFAQFSLGPYHPSAGYFPSPHHPGQPGLNVPPQQFIAPPLPPPPAATAAGPDQQQHQQAHHGARGWGGMQIQDQQRDGRGGHHGRGSGGPRNGFRGGPRGGGSATAANGRAAGAPGGAGRGWGGGRGRGRGRHANGYHHSHMAGDGGGYGVDAAEELLWRIKRLPHDARVQEVALQGLKYVDSRGLAGVMKDLGKANLAYRAFELFDFIRSLGPTHEFCFLLDEFTYTSCISNCVSQQDLGRALGLVEEMRARGIERNVHTFSALMNVCIKCGQYKLALDVYREMKQEGCQANVVTMNTLIDVYGKMGQWEQALGVLEQMKREHVHPVTRTFNTLMIACNTSSQWQEALRVYEEMISNGHEPNTTTFNALISAHSKAGDLTRVLQTFREMVQKGCERSVITYSSLISACEKAGEWQLALQLFDEMKQEGCVPNVISYNSLITACAQGAQWEKAGEVFEQMQAAGCRPDVVTYTALIQAYERGRQWRRALQAFEDMRARGCLPDTIVYTTIIDALWETGVAWAQRRAAALFRQACAENLMRRHSHQCGNSVELNLHSTTAGVALLSLHCWLQDLHDRVHERRRSPDAQQQGAGAGANSPEAGSGGCPLPDHICIIAGKGKGGNKDLGGGGNGPGGPQSVIKEAVTALLRSLRAPFKESADSTAFIGRLESSGQQVAEWLAAHGGEILSAIVPAAPAGALAAQLAAAAGAGAPARGEIPSAGAMDGETPKIPCATRESPSPLAAAGVPPTVAALAAAATSVEEQANNAEGAPRGGGQSSDSGSVSGSVSERSRSGSPPSPQPSLGVPPRPPSAAGYHSSCNGGGSSGRNNHTSGTMAGSTHSSAARAAAGGNVVGGGGASSLWSSQEEEESFKQEQSTEGRVVEAFNTIKFFEETHCLNLQVMSYAYLQQRPQLVDFACSVGKSLALPDEAVYDAVLLMDRVMSVPLKVADGLLGVLAAACVQVAAKQSPLPEGMAPSLADVCQVTGLPVEVVMQVQGSMLAALGNDTAALSALRCLKLYLERIGADHSPPTSPHRGGKAGRNPFRLLHETLVDSDFLNYRPSVVAAAVLFADRKSRGLAPYWPSALAALTGYSLGGTPELAAAVAGAQRLYEKLQVPAALWNYQPTAPQPISAGGGGSGHHSHRQQRPGNGGRGPSPPQQAQHAGQHAQHAGHQLAPPPSSPHSAPVSAGAGAAFLHSHYAAPHPQAQHGAQHAQQLQPPLSPHHPHSPHGVAGALPLPIPGAAQAQAHLLAASAALGDPGVGALSPHSLPQGAGAQAFLMQHLVATTATMAAAAAGSDPRQVACSL